MAGRQESWPRAALGQPGLLIWRIEHPKIVLWPKEQHGRFSSADTYIILETAPNGGHGDLKHHIFYWIGSRSILDELGAAAFKTLECDDHLRAKATESCELQGQESGRFKALFTRLAYIDASAPTAAARPPKLFQVAKTLGGGHVEQREVPLARESLKEHASFVFDAGDKIFIWSAPRTSPFAAHHAAQLAEDLQEQRRGGSVDISYQEGTKGEFWRLIEGVSLGSAAEGLPAAARSLGQNCSLKVGRVHMIVVALDYKKTRYALTCSWNGENVVELAERCGAKVEKLYNEHATVANVSALVREVASRCGPDDSFVFYYAGHGSGAPEDDFGEVGAEARRRDEFCLVDDHGLVSCDAHLRGEDFARLVTSGVHRETRIVLLADCRRPGAVVDLNHACWEGHHVVSLLGCQGQQASGNKGGGAFTHAMLLAVDDLAKRGQKDYSLNELYDEAVCMEDSTLKSGQDISIQTRPNGCMPWPLVPREAYTAPLRRRKAAGKAPCAADVPSEPAPSAPPASSSLAAAAAVASKAAAAAASAADGEAEAEAEGGARQGLPVSPRRPAAPAAAATVVATPPPTIAMVTPEPEGESEAEAKSEVGATADAEASKQLPTLLAGKPQQRPVAEKVKPSFGIGHALDATAIEGEPQRPGRRVQEAPVIEKGSCGCFRGGGGSAAHARASPMTKM
mmetsp:Transcript_87035/g.245502  ORF Transcript_87035/g.245502 Transcript_87035/m.245502 type:complete len:683 (-) Transcript_87035:327-2375(-)